MKTASLPPVRVEPRLRKEAQDLLEEGETLSSFVEQAIRRNIEFRRTQQAFLKRGIAAGERARRTGRYVEPRTLLDKLDRRLGQARRTARTAGR
jgi:hypothetical protein